MLKKGQNNYTMQKSKNQRYKSGQNSIWKPSATGPGKAKRVGIEPATFAFITYMKSQDEMTYIICFVGKFAFISFSAVILFG